MRKAVLEFLRFERDQLVAEVRQLEQGEREIYQVRGVDRTNITPQAALQAEARVDRFEEFIARWEAGVS